MSEQKIPIPAMLYNVAVGGHVTNSQQIIDEDYNIEQKDINKETLGIPYNAITPNGMGRIVLKKTDNFKQVVEAQSDGNTIFIIKYDFVLTDNTLIPSNCVLQFEGGSIKGSSTLTLQKTYVIGNKDIFDCTVHGQIVNEDICVDWFAGTDSAKIVKANILAGDNMPGTSGYESSGINRSWKNVVFSGRIYNITETVNITAGFIFIKGNNSLLNFTGTGNALYITSYWVYIENLHFQGDNTCAINVDTGNIDVSFITIFGCDFAMRTVSDLYAIRVNSISANCKIQNCRFSDTPHAIKDYCDMTTIENCWFNSYLGGSTPEGSCISHEQGYNINIYDCIFVPWGWVKNSRWIDLKQGHLLINGTRFGGEAAGMPIIWLYSGASAVYIENSVCHCGGAGYSFAGVITLMNEVIPREIKILNIETNGNLISPYGYIKDNGVTYNTEYDAAQAASDAFIDYILTDGRYKAVGIVTDHGNGSVQGLYYPCFDAFIKKSSSLNKTISTNTHALVCTVFYGYNVGTWPIIGESFDLEFIISGSYYANYFNRRLIYTIDIFHFGTNIRTKATLKNTIDLDSGGFSINDYIDASISIDSQDYSNINIYLDITIKTAEVTISYVNYKLSEVLRYKGSTQDMWGDMILLPNKSSVKIVR